MEDDFDNLDLGDLLPKFDIKGGEPSALDQSAAKSIGASDLRVATPRKQSSAASASKRRDSNK